MRTMILRWVRPVVLCSAWTMLAQAEILVLPPHSTVAGKSIGEWSADWWQWALSFSIPNDPFIDPTGINAGLNQSGPVFFLAGTPGGSSTRSFAIPLGKYVMVPLLVGELSQLEIGFTKTAEEVRQAAHDQADLIDSLQATIDGVAVPNLFDHREVSPDFEFIAAIDNPFGVPPGNSGIAVAEGYFLMLAPPPTGTHVINFGGGISMFSFSINDTDTIHVVPEPGSLILCGWGVLGIVIGVAYKRMAGTVT